MKQVKKMMKWLGFHYHHWSYSRNQNVRLCVQCSKVEFQNDGKWLRDDFIHEQERKVKIT